MATAGSAKYPFSLILLSVLAGGLLLSWLALFTLFLRQGDSLRLDAVADGRHVRIDLATGKVEGSTDAPAPVAETAKPESPTTSPATTLPVTVTEPPAASPATPATTEAPPSPAPAASPVRAPLNPAPNPALTDATGPFILPKAAPDGMTPAEYYKKPFSHAKGTPLVAVVVRDLGLNSVPTDAAIALDEYVSLSFSPYAPKLNDQVARARATGHEFWLQVPMEPEGYPANDAGPFSLLRTVSAEENLTLLHQVMATATGYAGLVAPPAELFSANSLSGPLADDIKERGLRLLQHRAVTAMPRYDDMLIPVSRTVAPTTTPEQLRVVLAEFESIARNRGYAVLSLPAAPGLLKELAAWIPTLADKKLALAPLSAIAVARQE